MQIHPLSIQETLSNTTLPRHYFDLDKYLEANKVLLILGPRRTGKTTLIEHYLEKTHLKYRFDSGELLNIQEILSSQDMQILNDYVGESELIVIDEAHKIPNIGLNLKLIVDHIPNIKVIATGSSSFDLLGQVGEPLVGRKWTLQLFPMAILELNKLINKQGIEQSLETFLIYGTYPDVIKCTLIEKKRKMLDELTQGYLFRDILELEKVKKPKILGDLLRLLAFQVGSEVSLSELANNLNINARTVERYLDLMEKSFILYNLRGYSRNLRKEITKKSKYYFYDNGVRNAIVSNFNPLNKRDDVGILWENFLVMERLKKQEYMSIYSNNYFWRTWEGQEIDWVEEREGKQMGYEFKWKKGIGDVKEPPLWKEIYPEADFEVVNKDNFLDFVC